MFRTSNFTIDPNVKNETDSTVKSQIAPNLTVSKKQENPSEEKSRSTIKRSVHAVDMTKKTSLGGIYPTQNRINLNTSNSFSIPNPANRSPHVNK